MYVHQDSIVLFCVELARCFLDTDVWNSEFALFNGTLRTFKAWWTERNNQNVAFLRLIVKRSLFTITLKHVDTNVCAWSYGRTSIVYEGKKASWPVDVDKKRKRWFWKRVSTSTIYSFVIATHKWKKNNKL